MNIFFFVFLVMAQVTLPAVLSAQDQAAETPALRKSQDLIGQAWEASGKNNSAKLQDLVDEMVKLYGDEAKSQQSQLKDFPIRGEEEKYQSLNDVGLILFIRAENLMNNGKTAEAVAEFERIIKDYPQAQAWDPSRGNFWSIKEKSQASIDVITGKVEEEIEANTKKIELVKPVLFAPGKQKVIDYTKYGTFLNAGKEDFHYTINDMQGLIEAVGEGIYPNTNDFRNNPRYKKAKEEGRLEGNHWDFVNSTDLEAAFFKWQTAPEPWGTRLFYIGHIFEKAGMFYEAIKTYQAIVVHFPKTVAWTYWQTPWYPAQAAIAKIRHLLRVHPELKLSEQGMEIQIHNGFDNDVKNDVILTKPGKIYEKSLVDQVKEKIHWEEKVKLGKVVKTSGKGEVRLVQYENGHWQLLVKDRPYVIKGVTYSPTKIGQSPDKGTLKNWMEEDSNNNGLVDGPYEAWVDKNRNNQQDSDEPVVGDFALMKEMGVNTLRIYNQPNKINKELLRKMYKEYGFRVIIGDFMGKYTLGSGATWFEGTDYDNPEHKKNMLESVKQMVMEFKDEPYVLMWLLGNENNYGVASNADKKPEVFYKFTDEVAQWIKSVDSNHPVAVSNGDTLYLDLFGKNTPNVDVFAANVYRGDYGFGVFWEQVKDASAKPVFISEYGCPAYAAHLTLDEGEEAQSYYHEGNWLDIEANLAGRAGGVGNALGGVVFEWLDEWWKNYEPFIHDRKSDAIGPFPGGYYYEEWFGIIGQGKGQHSPFLRQLRKSYFMYKNYWNKTLRN